jgi:SpoVK/Ycf46/Vps4 family AAA+-type ATPase
MFLRRALRQYQGSDPDVAEGLRKLLAEKPTRSSVLRESDPLPVDMDSRLDLLRFEPFPNPDVTPVFKAEIQSAFDQLIVERRMPERLLEAGLAPTRSVLMTGPPGVGKTLAAKWLAKELHIPLLTLDLSAVMSSFLGRTGTNVRHVLDYAKRQECILFLDEFDAVAKRRDDASEIGELKRLVNVLLQEIDEWPASGLLLAATNHPDLLDPAVWRRFDLRLEFGMPSTDEVRKAIGSWLHKTPSVDEALMEVLTIALEGQSLSEVSKYLLKAQRSAVLTEEPLEDHLRLFLRDRILMASKSERVKAAVALTNSGISQREVHSLTGVSRDTIRKYAKPS